jgi:hypothetical protein
MPATPKKGAHQAQSAMKQVARQGHCQPTESGEKRKRDKDRLL